MYAIRRVTLVVALSAALGGVGADSAAAATCHDTDVLPHTSAEIATARTTVLCLVNHERTTRGMTALKANRTLRKVATRLSRDMVAKQYFDHTSPSGTTFAERLHAVHWRGRSAGENIAWGSGPRGTPAQIVDAWMHSPGHRANILNKAFRRGGVGIASQAPQAGVGSAATYSMDYDTP